MLTRALCTATWIVLAASCSEAESGSYGDRPTTLAEPREADGGEASGTYDPQLLATVDVELYDRLEHEEERSGASSETRP